jgi:hypothetical protein
MAVAAGMNWIHLTGHWHTDLCIKNVFVVVGPADRVQSACVIDLDSCDAAGANANRELTEVRALGSNDLWSADVVGAERVDVLGLNQLSVLNLTVAWMSMAMAAVPPVCRDDWLKSAFRPGVIDTLTKGLGPDGTDLQACLKYARERVGAEGRMSSNDFLDTVNRVTQAIVRATPVVRSDRGTHLLYLCIPNATSGSTTVVKRRLLKEALAELGYTDAEINRALRTAHSSRPPSRIVTPAPPPAPAVGPSDRATKVPRPAALPARSRPPRSRVLPPPAATTSQNATPTIRVAPLRADAGTSVAKGCFSVLFVVFLWALLAALTHGHGCHP